MFKWTGNGVLVTKSTLYYYFTQFFNTSFYTIEGFHRRMNSSNWRWGLHTIHREVYWIPAASNFSTQSFTFSSFWHKMRGVMIIMFGFIPFPAKTKEDETRNMERFPHFLYNIKLYPSSSRGSVWFSWS